MTVGWAILMAILTILAILFAPIIALRVSARLDRDKELRKRQLDIFTTLMATRSAILSPEHVKALNAIDIEFYRNAEIIGSWRIYLDHLNYSNIQGQKPKNEQEWKIWGEKSQELLVDLLEKMASALNFKFSKVDIKRAHYRPQAYLDIETDQTIIRKGLTQIFEGKKWFPIMTWLTQPPPLPDQKSSEGAIAEKSSEKTEVKK